MLCGYAVRGRGGGAQTIVDVFVCEGVAERNVILWQCTSGVYAICLRPGSKPGVVENLQCGSMIMLAFHLDKCATHAGSRT